MLTFLTESGAHKPTNGHAAPMMTTHFILETMPDQNQVILIEAGLE